MAVVFVDGFDKYPDDPDIANGVSTDYWIPNVDIGYMENLVAGRFGGKCVAFSPIGSIDRFAARPVALPAGIATMGIAMKISTGLSGMSNDIVIAAFGVGSVRSGLYQISLTLGADGLLRVYRGDRATLLATQATVVLVENAWFFIEFSVVVADAGGSFDVRIDGVSVLSGSGVDTKQQTTAGIETVSFGGDTSAGNRPRLYFDDLYVSDSSTPLGPCFVETLFPSADTADKAFERSSGADNYALIDDASDETGYVRASAPGARDLFQLPDLSTYPDSVFAVVVNTLAKQENPGDNKFRSLVKSGALVTGETAANISGNSAWRRVYYTTDPQSLLPWQGYSVNALKVGYEIT